MAAAQRSSVRRNPPGLRRGLQGTRTKATGCSWSRRADSRRDRRRTVGGLKSSSAPSRPCKESSRTRARTKTTVVASTP